MNWEESTIFDGKCHFFHVQKAPKKKEFILDLSNSLREMRKDEELATMKGLPWGNLHEENMLGSNIYWLGC
jgi:hypothetical protein